MDRLIERCAGLDVHKDTVAVCVRVPDESGGRASHTATFATTTGELIRLRSWLADFGVTHVAMEATGVYWKPVYYVLEGGMTVWLCNAYHLKNVPGRKTDMADAAWIAELVEHGLLRPSFVPPPPIRQLRELTRYRRAQIEERARELQRLDKVLQDAGIKLSSVASRMDTKSGLAMIAALIDGERDPVVLADRALGRMKPKIGALREALQGRFDSHHAQVCRSILTHLQHLDQAIAALDEEIAARRAPYQRQIELLCTIPGIARRNAEVLIAEIGVDMRQFPTAGHLASWAGMCPGNYQSAGKRRSGKTRPGPTWLHKTLIEAAKAASRSKGTFLAARYARLAGRRGSGRATVAIGHSILVIAWHLLTTGEPYSDLGADYYLNRYSVDARRRRLIRQLENLGLEVTASTKQ